MTRPQRKRKTQHETLQPEVLELYRHALPSARSGPLYNAFSYPTKISPEVIALFIATHTTLGSTVVDAFAGSGTTGLAAKLCDNPTALMREIADKFGLTPVWGPRHAALYELSVIGSFVAQVMCNPPDPELFAAEAKILIDEAYKKLLPILTVTDDEGKKGLLRHIIWSDVLKCVHCGDEHLFWDVAVDQYPLRIRNAEERYSCSACKKSLSLGMVERAVETVFDEVLGRTVKQRKRVPVRVYGKTGTRKWQRPIARADAVDQQFISTFPLPRMIPNAELELGDLYRSGYHFGLTHLHHLYTRRNLISVATLLELIEERPAVTRDALRMLVLSYNQSHATLMTRVVVKDGGSDFVLTGAQSGVLYVSSLPVEKNVLEGVARKVKPMHDSFALVGKSRSTVVVNNQSSTTLNELNASVDYIFTDPPFADFIPYAEINQINELWLGKRTNTTEEAIISPTQGKALADYERLMSAVFGEVSRVLKPTGMATVVFHAAKASVWAALQAAYRSAGLDVTATSVLDKLQSSFKQVVSAVSVKGDPLLLLAKTRTPNDDVHKDTEALLLELMSKANGAGDPAELEPQRLYSRYVSKCLEAGSGVEMNADDFYLWVQGAALQ